MSKNFFEKKEKKQVERKVYPFNLEAKDDLTASGLDKEDNPSFIISNDLFFDKLIEQVSERSESKENIVGLTCVNLEKNFTSREISFLLAKSMLSSMFEEANKELLTDK